MLPPQRTVVDSTCRWCVVDNSIPQALLSIQSPSWSPLSLQALSCPAPNDCTVALSRVTTVSRELQTTCEDDQHR